MGVLRKDIIAFRTARPCSEEFKLKFLDWIGVQSLLQSAAKTFERNSDEAKRLQELSLCSDSKSSEILNKDDVPHLIKKVFWHSSKRIFP